MATIDWRHELQPRTRKRVVERIMKDINEYHDFDDEDELQEVEKFCRSFEQKTFASAMSKADYKRKIDSKKVEMQRKLLEEMLQKVKMFREVYLPELVEMYQKIANRHQQNEPQKAQRWKKKKERKKADRVLYIMGKWVKLWIQMLRVVNLPELTEMFRFTAGVQQEDSLPQQAVSDNHEALSFFKEIFETIPSSLAISSQEALSPFYRNGLIEYEKKVINFIYANRPRKMYYVQPGEVSSHAMLSLPQQQEVYRKIQMLKEMYLPELNEMHQKIASKVWQIDSYAESSNLRFRRPIRCYERPKLQKIKEILERIIAFLQTSKSDISPALKEELPLIEDHIITFINVNRSHAYGYRCHKLYILSVRGNLEEFIVSKIDFD